jgi:hypothetical protein
MSCVLSDRFHEKRTALAAIQQQPQPKIGAFAGSSDRSPSTSDKREVEENDRIRSSKPNFDSIIRPQVTIDYPSILLDKPLLHFDPLIARCRGKTWPPEDLVQFYQR